MMKKMVFLFLILALVLVGCGKKEENVVKKETVNEIRDLKEAEISTLMERVDDLSYFDINPAKSFKTSELTNQEVLLWAQDYIGDINGTAFSELEDLAAKYLDFSLEPEHVICMTHSNILGSSDNTYLYDVDTKTFVKNDSHVTHSNKGFYSYVINKYDSSSYENGNYIISVYKLFSDTEYKNSKTINGNFNFYSNYSDAKSSSNPIYTNIGISSVKEKLNNLEDNSNLVKYTYTFKLKDDNYVLKSYEINQ